ncbi:MAG: hypothetical protein MAG451_01681 [Anaerolineales bacterium]|nr:hypothetical protein [Anaerolineales bacterium]
MRVRQVLERRQAARQTAIEKATAYARRLQEALGPLTVVLYGSYARGDFGLHSDIDVIIISDALPGDPLDRLAVLHRYVSGNLEPKGYTPSEFLNLVDRRRPVILDILDHGVVLVDSGLWKTITEAAGTEHRQQA